MSTRPTQTKQEIAVAFEKLGLLLQSGVPFLQAVRTVVAECRDKVVAEALGDIHAQAEQKKDIAGVLAKYEKTFPQSVQLLWRVGNLAPAQLEACCLRIAAILKTELGMR